MLCTCTLNHIFQKYSSNAAFLNLQFPALSNMYIYNSIVYLSSLTLDPRELFVTKDRTFIDVIILLDTYVYYESRGYIHREG